jgi:antitoxin VapB
MYRYNVHWRRFRVKEYLDIDHGLRLMQVERLAEGVAAMANETKTETARRVDPGKAERLRRLLEEHIWPTIHPEVRGKTITKEEREAILGYGPDGV